jgi:hypothetical protein
MDKIFVFGKATHGVNFTDREKETTRLVSNFENGINTILISPRRWGKTSLVRKASKIVNEQNGLVKVISLDGFLCRTEADFYMLFSTEIIKQTSSKWEEWIDNAKRLLSRVSPKITIGSDPINDFSLSFDITSGSHSENDILDLPQKIAEEKGISIVVCIDEFQQIAEFSHSKKFQKKMRSVWQLQSKVSYCLYGSKMHILSELFSKQSMPFYKFGDVIFLQKISEKDWVKFICSRFEQSGKSISVDYATRICQTVDCHSSYVQQFSWLVWIKTQSIVSEENFIEALEDLFDQNKILFYRNIEELTSYQLNFLRAIVNGLESEFTKSENLKKYNLGTSANVSRLKKSLEQKEIIDIAGKKVSIQDPVFKLWLKNEMIVSNSNE